MVHHIDLDSLSLILSNLQSEKENEVVFAINACQKVFCKLLERGELYVVGQLPKEEEILQGKCAVDLTITIFQ